MSTARAERTPAIPQPPARAEELRAALAQIAPSQLTLFDEDRARATDTARADVSATPLRVFAESWAVEVAILRHPERAARLRDLERQTSTVTEADEALAITCEISKIRRTAATEAGLNPAGAAQ